MVVNRTVVGWLLVATQVAVFVVLAVLPWRSPSVVSVILAIPFVVIGGWLGFAAFGTLGSALTPTPVPISGAGLRTNGPYARVRHPIYTAVLSLTLAALILAGTWWSWAWSVVIVLFFWGKSRWEDTLLAQEYGNEWEVWAQQTGALIPRRRRSAP
jgi:protein-S-isoprenylcysteine O-methyltransferase Ste14